LHLYLFRLSIRSMLLVRRSQTEATGYRGAPAVTIRWAAPEDADSVAILAEIDEAPVPSGPLLLAFAGDELWVALSLSTGTSVSDPFRPSAEVAALVLERARQLTVPEKGRARAGVRRLQQVFAGSGPSLPR
jgi:hypothetical protein